LTRDSTEGFGGFVKSSHLHVHCTILGGTKQLVLHKVFDRGLNIVFNVVVYFQLIGNLMRSDKQLIEELGGPAKVAKLLGYDKHGGVQRVQNWTYRGIPPKVKIEYPDLFLTLQLSTNSPTSTEEQVTVNAGKSES
jgi:hypothetical protein